MSASDHVLDLTCHGPGGNRRIPSLVKVRVRLFAALRERAGIREPRARGRRRRDRRRRVAELGLGDEPPGLLYAVNRAYVERARFGGASRPGDEVAVIPPVSGGDFRLSAEPAVGRGRGRGGARRRGGAIATFIGTTRAHSRGRDVLYLDYEAYEGMAGAGDGRSRRRARRARHELCKVAIHHRVGRVEIGETSVVIAVSAPHRAAALAACREAIDELKVSVPLWKKEAYVGGEEWIGQGS